MLIIGSSASLAFTITSLTTSTTVGRQSAIVTSAYDDYEVTVTVKTSSSTIGSSKACYIYLLKSQDGTNWAGSSAEAAGGGDSGFTLDAVSNQQLIGVLNCPASSVTYRFVVPSIAACCGGVLPTKWALALTNDTNQTLDASIGGATYSPVTY